MAFQNMIEGDCGGQNPLMKLGTHFSQEPAFMQERVLTLPPGFSDSECLVNDFLEDRYSQNLQSFRMDTLAEELRDIDRFSRNPLSQAPNVAQLAPRETGAIWSEEFLRAEKHGAGLLQDFDPSALAGAITVPHFESVARKEVGAVGAIGSHRAISAPRAGPSQADVSWNAEFENKTEEAADSAWIQSFLHNRQDELGLVDLSAGSTESESKFQKFWQRTGEDETKDESVHEAAAGKLANEVWLEGYGTDDLEEEWNATDNKDFWQSMQKMWQSMSTPDGAAGTQWNEEFSAFVDPYKEYKFEETNPLKDVENPFEEGLKKLEAQDVPSAVLCFEAAVQAEPENALAWQYLGTTQAKNEQDPFVIAALKKCLSLEPDNLTALLDLAISYTNENYQNSACQMLREWLVRNPKYKDLPAPPAKQFFASSLLDNDFHREIKDYFIAAANKNPVGEIDQGVQCALGVLFNLNYDYDKAVDCFKAALQVAPTDYEMWNRLGATLANGNRSEEAVDAYYNALQLSPGFIRARYNLGITCINLGANREAAEHLLSALNQQAKGTTSRGEKGGMSDSIWNTLRLVVSQLGNPELLPAVEKRDLETLNREYGVK